MAKSNYSDMWVFIPVGGKGSRLMPFTKNRGKPLVPLFNHFPICEIIIFHLAQLGFRKFIFGVRGTDHYHQLNDYFQGGYGFSAGLGIKPQVEFEYQNPNYIDSGSADSCLYNIVRLGITKPVLVTMGDNLFDPAKLANFINQSLNAPYTFCVALQPTSTPQYFGIAELNKNNQINRFVEKPSPKETTSNLANCGIYIIKPAVFDTLEGDFGKNTLPKLAKNNLLGGFPIAGWLNLDTPVQHLSVFQSLLAQPETLKSFLNQTYRHYPLKAGNLWLRGKSRYAIRRNQSILHAIKSGRLTIKGTVLIGRDCQIGDQIILDNCSLGDMTILDNGSIINNSNILDAWSIGENVTIRNSFLGRGGQIGDCSSLTNCFIADGITLKSKTLMANQTLPLMVSTP